MSSRGVWYVIQRSIPTPAWIRWPEQQRFCCCCSVRTGASLIGWFNFIFNSLYAGMLVLALSNLRNLLDQDDQPWSIPPEIEGAVVSETNNLPEGSAAQEVQIPTGTNVMVGIVPSDREEIEYLKSDVMPMMYKSLAIPAIMIIFSILWLISVEARTIGYVRLFGKAFMVTIIVQLIMQLGFLAYADHKSRVATGNEVGISWTIWTVFVVYSLLNLYFVPVIREYISRRIKESKQGLEQGLLTSEMHPKSRVAEAYIEDAFTLEGDSDVVRFEASLQREYSSTKDSEPDAEDGYHPI